MSNKLVRLYGGHRNRVFRTDGKVKVVWKDGFKRQKQIREGVLLENFVAVHTDIKARMLVDKSNPVREEDGKLVTYFHYTEGEIRYPWNLEEIASVAKLLGKFHSLFPGAQKVQPFGTERLHLIRLHLDFARGNVLFQPRTVNATGVIDFETTAKGPVEQELGRSLSFILVDSPKDSVFSIQYSVFEQRLDALLTNYGLPYRKEDVIKWTKKYLSGDDFGNLNNVRDVAMQFINSLTN